MSKEQQQHSSNMASYLHEVKLFLDHEVHIFSSRVWVLQREGIKQQPSAVCPHLCVRNLNRQPSNARAENQCSFTISHSAHLFTT